MAGHSKFANIKHKKAKADAQKGKIFTKLGREIAVAVKEGGPDPNNNRKLKDIIAKAKSNNMPNDTIERSIKKAAGEGDSIHYEEILYEGYGPSGVAVIVQVLTDNKNRTAANVRHAFTKGGGNLGTTGCVSFMFDKKGQIVIERAEDINEDDLMMLALEAGAEDFIAEEEGYEIITTPEDFSTVRETIEEQNIPMLSAEVAMIPQTTTALSDPEDVKKMNKLLELLEEDDDVQEVFHNWEEDDE
ncbi:MAG: YebC/PmpR family DNA-binding transcriptional regulator [Epulopiscium sp.]|nr:YebC/PmpR family DNA-binding transcriptional regulator [Candidatus Epulonipiscium sp.]